MLDLLNLRAVARLEVILNASMSLVDSRRRVVVCNERCVGEVLSHLISQRQFEYTAYM